MGLFDFISMADNYEQRKVANFKSKDCTIDTAAVTDSTQPYETAVQHKKYNNGKWVIVELYDTKEEAFKGHQKWMTIMTKAEIPDKLTDVGTSVIRSLIDGPIEYKKEE